MHVMRSIQAISGTALLALSMVLPAGVAAGERMVFGGGPAGGTFQIVANAIQTYEPVKESEDYTVKAQSSAGSLENLRRIKPRQDAVWRRLLGAPVPRPGRSVEE